MSCVDRIGTEIVEGSVIVFAQANVIRVARVRGFSNAGNILTKGQGWLSPSDAKREALVLPEDFANYVLLCLGRVD